MNRPSLIIIGGIPGSGKTTLGNKLAKHFGLPILNKDGIIELLFEEIGVEENEKNIPQLRSATYKILCYAAEQICLAGDSLIIEGNFNSESGTPELLGLIKKGLSEVFLIECICSKEVAFDRFKKRHDTEERHQLHPRRDTLEEYAKRFLDGRDYSLSVLGEPIKFDTSVFLETSHEELISKLSGRNKAPD